MIKTTLTFQKKETWFNKKENATARTGTWNLTLRRVIVVRLIFIRDLWVRKVFDLTHWIDDKSDRFWVVCESDRLTEIVIDWCFQVICWSLHWREWLQSHTILNWMHFEVFSTDSLEENLFSWFWNVMTENILDSQKSYSSETTDRASCITTATYPLWNIEKT
jgi:hypothetical protein